jgi:hypothetical protein
MATTQDPAAHPKNPASGKYVAKHQSAPEALDLDVNSWEAAALWHDAGIEAMAASVHAIAPSARSLVLESDPADTPVRLRFQLILDKRGREIILPVAVAEGLSKSVAHYAAAFEDLDDDEAFDDVGPNDGEYIVDINPSPVPAERLAKAVADWEARRSDYEVASRRP